jgi:hypothetical protein
MTIKGKENVYYPLPRVKGVMVSPPGEERRYFATVPSEGNSDQAVFPQCPLSGEPYQTMDSVAIPPEWIQEPLQEEPESPDTSKNPEVREGFEEFLGEAKAYHANVAQADWEALEPATDRYNCIANSLGNKNEWVFPSFKKADFLELYQEQSYLPLGEMDYSHQPELEKVVLYGVGPSDPGYQSTIRGAIGRYEYEHGLLITHAARQEPDGLYSSKFGAEELIATSSPDDVAGESYGRPLVVLARLRS